MERKQHLVEPDLAPEDMNPDSLDTRRKQNTLEEDKND